MFEQINPKIYIDSFTRRVMLTHLGNDLGLKKEFFTSFIDHYFTTEYTDGKNGLQQWLEDDSLHNELNLHIIDLCVNINETVKLAEVKVKKIFPPYINDCLYMSLKAQQIWDNYVSKNNPRTSKIWLVDMGDYKAIVSGYNWNIVERKYPWCIGKKHTSLVKLDMTVEDVNAYHKLIVDNPWAFIPIDDDKNNKGDVIKFAVELYVPEEWVIDNIKLDKTMLKEEDIRILGFFSKSLTD